MTETILKPLISNEIDLYKFLDGFVSFESKGSLAVKSRIIHLGAVKSYLSYHDIDIIPSKSKNRVTSPRLYREDEEALDGSQTVLNELPLWKSVLACCPPFAYPSLYLCGDGIIMSREIEY